MSIQFSSDNEPMHIISSPVLFSLKLPNSGWLNLALIRQLEEGTINGRTFCRVTWHGGEVQNFHGDDALAILMTWKDATKKYYRVYGSKPHDRRISI